jgi:hypothetical protein
LEAHIDPKLRELVNQNSASIAKAQKLLDDCMSKKLPMLEENRRKINDFNVQINEAISIIEDFRNLVNSDYENITSRNEAKLQPHIAELQNYINTTAASIRKANQLIEDFEVDYNQLQALFNNHQPTLNTILDRFQFSGDGNLRNLKKLALKLNYIDPLKASLKISPILNNISISTTVPNKTSNLASGPSAYPAAGHLPYSIPIPDPIPNPVSYQMPNPMPNSIPNKIPYAVPNKIPNSVPNKIPNAVPNKIPNQVPQDQDRPDFCPITEQWYFRNMRENTWEPFAPRENELIVKSKKLGVKEVLIHLGSTNISGTVNLEKNKLYLPNNRWFYISSNLS